MRERLNFEENDFYGFDEIFDFLSFRIRRNLITRYVPIVLKFSTVLPRL